METVSSGQLSEKTDLEEYDLVVLGSGTGSSGIMPRTSLKIFRNLATVM